MAGFRRFGPLLLVEDADGCRHAVRPSAVLCLSDADAGRTETVVTLPGGRRLLLLSALDDVMEALAPSVGWRHGSDALEQPVADT